MKMTSQHPIFVDFCCLPALILATGTLLEGAAVGFLLAICLMLSALLSLFPAHRTIEVRTSMAVILPALFASLALLGAVKLLPWLVSGRYWLIPLCILSLGLPGLFATDEMIGTSDTLRGSMHSSLHIVLTFTIFSLCREILTYGTIFAFPGGKGGLALPGISGTPRKFFASVAGAFLLLAIFVAVSQLIFDRKEKEKETPPLPEVPAVSVPESTELPAASPAEELPEDSSAPAGEPTEDEIVLTEDEECLFVPEDGITERDDAPAEEVAEL